MLTNFHNEAVALAVKAAHESAKKYEGAPNDLVRDACHVISHDAVCVHRAIGALADAGWSGPAAALLRTLLDLNISALAIVKSARPKMAAFRYFYSGFRRYARDVAFPKPARDQMRSQARNRISSLPKSLRPEALDVLREKDRPYWFAPEWHKPTDIIKQFGGDELNWLYAQSSAAAHGTFFGMRLFRDEPDRIDINPRTYGPKAMSLDHASCRFLVEIVHIRDTVEQLGLARDIEDFRSRFAAIGTQLKSP